MKISNVISYLGAYENLELRFQEELAELNGMLNMLSVDRIRAAKSRFSRQDVNDEINFGKFSACWDSITAQMGWVENRKIYNDSEGKRIYYQRIGVIKNGISLRFMASRSEFLTSWVFQDSALAFKNGIAEIPICLQFTKNANRDLFGERRPMQMLSAFERFRYQLLALQPMSLTHPFIIVGVDFDYDRELVVEEIKSTSDVSPSRIAVDRSIEFPPEYQQAGIGILSYFGKLIKEKYPEENISFKIMQLEDAVRLIVETPNGNKEIFEKEFREYEEVIKGDRPVESFATTQAMIVELRSELRIAEARIGMQQDLLALKDDQMSKFLEIIHAQVSSPIDIQVKPVINIEQNNTQSNHVEVIHQLFGDLSELAELSKADPSVSLLTEGLVAEMEEVASGKLNLESLKASPIPIKIKKVVEEGLNAGSRLSGIFSKVEGAIDKLKEVGVSYNMVAEWCGLPVIPSVLLK